MSDKPTPLGSSAAARTGGYVLPVADYESGRGVEMRTTFETHLGLFHVLADGTILLRVNQDALLHSPPGPMVDECHVEMTDDQAADVARVLLKLSLAAENRRKLLDGRAGFAFTNEDGRWWASHDGDAMQLRTLKTKLLKPQRCTVLDFDTKTSTEAPFQHAARRKCAACKAVLTGTIYVHDKATKSRLKAGRWGDKPMWSTYEFCTSCVEAPKRTGLALVGAP